MTVRQDLAGVVNNDIQLTFALTYNDKPLNLTGYTVAVVVKPSAASLDSAGVAYTVGSGITVLSAPAGRFQLNIPHSATSVSGVSWYRVDVTNGGAVSSAMCGALSLMAA